MRATTIKMIKGLENSSNVQEIDEIYLEGSKLGFYKKEIVHDYLVKNPKSIQVDIHPYPNLVPVTSANDEKYVRSEANDSKDDNLLKLPRV